MRQTVIRTGLAVDPPIAQDANFQVDRDYIAYTDAQARGAQQHLVESLLSGVTCTWITVDGTSPTLTAGDVVCLASSTTGVATVTLATWAALATAHVATGIVVSGAAPGSKARVAVNGTLAPSVTGLAATTGFARVSSVGRIERVAALGPSDYPLGAIDAQGYVRLFFMLPTSVLGVSSGVADLAALAALDDTSFTNGAIIGVATLHCPWELVNGSTATPDGITVIAANSATANWHRLSIASTHWLTQAAWHIDPSAGNDENSGASSGAKIKTWAELRRRLGSQAITQTTTFTIYGDLPTSDPLRPPRIGPLGCAIITGQRTTVYTGSVTAATASVPSTNTPWSLTDSAIPTSWTASSLLNKRLRVTSGARATATCWVSKDNGAKSARFGEPILLNTTLPITGFTLATLQVGDPFVVESLTSVATLLCDEPILCDFSTGNPSKVIFVDIAFGQGSVERVGFQQAITFIGCDIAYMTGSFAAYGCLLRDPQFLAGDAPIVCAGTITGSSLTVGSKASLQVSQGTLLQGVTADIYGDIYWGTSKGLAIFDSAGYGMNINPGGTARAGGTGSPLWGSGNATRGVRLFSGQSLLNYDATKPTITGTSGDLMAAGRAFAWTDVPLWASGASVNDTL